MRKRERELHARASRKCGHAESLIRHSSFSQSVSMGDYDINWSFQFYKLVSTSPVLYYKTFHSYNCCRILIS